MNTDNLITPESLAQSLKMDAEGMKKPGVMKSTVGYMKLLNTYIERIVTAKDRGKFVVTHATQHIDMVPNLSLQNIASVEIGKDFMLSHGYIKNDFDVHQWAAPEFLEKAARELMEEEWKKRTTAKLPETAAQLQSGERLG